MADPNWNRGFYYDGLPPHTGMKLARQIATITYRSGPEWDQRFGRQLRVATPEQLKQVEETGKPRGPMICPRLPHRNLFGSSRRTILPQIRC
jgi:homoserine acetyltransferase